MVVASRRWRKSPRDECHCEEKVVGPGKCAGNSRAGPATEGKAEVPWEARGETVSRGRVTGAQLAAAPSISEDRCHFDSASRSEEGGGLREPDRVGGKGVGGRCRPLWRELVG